MKNFSAQSKKYSAAKRLGLFPALLVVFSLLLSACGGNQPNATQPTADPSITAAVQLPPVTIDVSGTTGAATTSATSTSASASPTAEVTSTPVVAATPTVATSSPTAEPTSTASPTTVATPTSGAGATTTAETAITATPTVSGTLETIDRDAELKTIKAAYDAINKHLFKEPDANSLLNAGLKEVASITGQTPPTNRFTGVVDSDWDNFTAQFNKLLDSDSGFKYPKYQLARRIVNVMADAVGDEHTYYMDPASYQSRQNLLSGDNSSVGFGVVVTTQDSKAYIVRVVSGSPAEKAGIKDGDQIVEYDGMAINDKTWGIIKNAAENEAHTFVLARSGSPNITVQVKKGAYTLPTVEYRLINGHIGYIAIRDFFLNVADETDKAMTALRAQGADSWILDVRENPGGINVEQVTGRFVSGGEIMGYDTNRTSHDPMKVNNDLQDSPNKGKPFSPLLPLVLLQDDVSASSSEMLALAVQDFKLGPVIGIKSAGALGHTAAYPLGDGSAISVTVDVYESVSGKKVNGVGVTPDMTVERSIDDIVAGRDPQLTSGVDYLEKLVAKKNP